MDVSGWTVDELMRLPDWCFGNRELYGCRVANNVPNTGKWFISTIALPDPACIWSGGIFISENDHQFSHVRWGLRSAVPTSEAEMNSCINFLPEFGNPAYAPPRILLPAVEGFNIQLQIRKGVVTGGTKFVCEGFLHAAGTMLTLTMYIVASGMPTSMASWLSHSK